VCIALCTIVAHNIAQNRPDSFPLYPPDNHHCSDDVYLREGGADEASTDSNNVRMPRPMPAKAMPYHSSTCGHIWASQRHWLEMIALLPRRRQQPSMFSHWTSQSCHRPPVSTHTHMHTCTCTRAHAHMCTRAHAHMHTCTHVHMHTCTHAHTIRQCSGCFLCNYLAVPLIFYFQNIHYFITHFRQKNPNNFKLSLVPVHNYTIILILTLNISIHKWFQSQWHNFASISTPAKFTNINKQCSLRLYAHQVHIKTSWLANGK